MPGETQREEETKRKRQRCEVERENFGPWAYWSEHQQTVPVPSSNRHLRILSGQGGSDRVSVIWTSHLASSLTSFSTILTFPSLIALWPQWPPLFLRLCSICCCLRAFASAMLSGMLFPKCFHGWLHISQVFPKCHLFRRLSSSPLQK